MTPWLCKKDRKSLAADLRKVLATTACPPDKIEAIAAGIADKIGTDPEISEMLENLPTPQVKSDLVDVLDYLIKHGGPVHPTEYRGAQGESALLAGMTLRDRFAGQALQGIIAGDNSEHVLSKSSTAEECYRFADAMLVARKR